MAIAEKNLKDLETETDSDTYSKIILDGAGIPCADLSSAKINDTLYSRIHGDLVVHSINPECPLS